MTEIMHMIKKRACVCKGVVSWLCAHTDGGGTNQGNNKLVESHIYRE